MTDRICSVCNTPKPPCCFEYAASHGDICQPCHRDADHARRARDYHSERGHRRSRQRNDALATRHPDRYADGIATWVERRGA